VATTFSTDTPNLVTNFVRERGVAGNWAWWAFLLTGIATVFFYSRLWRRSRVLTDLEFYELRYSGKAARFVRGFRAVYLGLLFNCVIMATVNLAAAKIAAVLLGWPMWQTLAVCAVLNVAFAATSGLWGVMVTDMIQFGIAMTGSIAAAVYALRRPEVGGLSELFARIPADTLRTVPDFGNWPLTLTLLVFPLTVQWWAVWYPGAEPGGVRGRKVGLGRVERDALSCRDAVRRPSGRKIAGVGVTAGSPERHDREGQRRRTLVIAELQPRDAQRLVEDETIRVRHDPVVRVGIVDARDSAPRHQRQRLCVVLPRAGGVVRRVRDLNLVQLL
jgi:hypothetical protein